MEKKDNDKEKSKQKDDTQEYIQKLLDGKVAIPNEMVRYFLEEIKTNTVEARAVTQTLQQAEQVTEQSRQRLVELRGIGRKYIQDIMATKDRKLDEPEDRRIITPATIPQPRI